jgi:alanine racemase
MPPLPGRLRIVDGYRGAILLDDTYDAELACTLGALDALANHFAGRRRIAVLGGLHGEADRVSGNAEIGKRASERADLLVLKGEQTQQIREGALSAGTSSAAIFETFTDHEAIRYLGRIIEPDDVVLIKGPKEERMEEITRGLMRDPSQAHSLLIRQQEAFRQVQMELPQRPTWIDIDLEAVVHNLRLVQAMLDTKAQLMVVLKADGYGHGAIRIARTVINNGAQMLGVACLSEAVTLRRAGIQAPILILGYTPAWQARETVLYDVTATVFDLETLQAFDRAAAQVGRIANVHVKIDTGMGRLGLLPDQVLPVFEQATQLANVTIQGVFTHFSVADEADKSYTYRQLECFGRVLSQIRRMGIEIPIVHASNSAALLSVPEARFDMVRVGIALYGLSPSPDTLLPDEFRPALSFKTRIAQVKVLPPGSYVSYGNTYRTKRYERIAVIPVGYADGFRRAPGTWGFVLIRGESAPIVGRVCMDQTMVNVTRIPDAQQGDEVVLIGQQGQAEITVDDVAKQLGTINYEVVSEILARVPRVS